MCDDWMLIVSSVTPTMIVFLVTRYYYKKKLDTARFYFKNILDEMEQYV
jgi:hypothetical protein